MFPEERKKVPRLPRLIEVLSTFYERALSPLLFALGVRCRFHPTCSRYARESFEQKPFFAALWLSARRLVKCSPLHPGGYDPIR